MVENWLNTDGEFGKEFITTQLCLSNERVGHFIYIAKVIYLYINCFSFEFVK